MSGEREWHILAATTKIFPYQPLQVYEIWRFVQPVQCEMYLPSHWNCKACRFSVLLEVSHPEMLRERAREKCVMRKIGTTLIRRTTPTHFFRFFCVKRSHMYQPSPITHSPSESPQAYPTTIAIRRQRPPQQI